MCTYPDNMDRSGKKSEITLLGINVDGYDELSFALH